MSIQEGIEVGDKVVLMDRHSRLVRPGTLREVTDTHVTVGKATYRLDDPAWLWLLKRHPNEGVIYPSP